MYLVDERGQRYSLTRPVSLVGRSSHCDIVLPYKQVSREHARLQKQGNKLVLTDLQSSNGTFVNDRPISTAQALSPGDMIPYFCANRPHFYSGAEE